MSLKHSVGQVEGSLQAKNQPDSSSYFDIIPACDRRTDRWTHDGSTYRPSIALHCKNQ